MAPPEVLDYVVAHEVAHLIEMNHSRAFWAVVAQVCPDYKAPRQWLHDNAPSLHRYRFRD
jgi:predicted metal-dependent hydrolase